MNSLAFYQFITHHFGENQNLDELNQLFRESLLAYGSETENNLRCAENVILDFDENQTIAFFLLESKTKISAFYQMLLENETYAEPIHEIIEIWRNYSESLINPQKLEQLSNWTWAMEEDEKPLFLPITQKDWETLGRFTTLILQNLYENLPARQKLLNNLNAFFANILLFQKSVELGNVIFIQNNANDFSIGEIELIFDEIGKISRYEVKIWKNDLSLAIRFFEVSTQEQLLEKIQEKLLVLGLLEEKDFEQIKEIFENTSLSELDKHKEAEKLIKPKLDFLTERGISDTQSINLISDYLYLAA